MIGRKTFDSRIDGFYFTDAILTYGIYAGILIHMDAVKKITVHVPKDLLSRAQEATGQGITPTIRRGLELVATGRAYEKLRGLRGQVKLDLDPELLREDR